MEKPTIIDENCFVVPPLPGPGDDSAFSGKPFISGVTPAPALGRLFDVDNPMTSNEGEPDGAD